MTAKVLRFPSRGSQGELCLAFRTDHLGFPKRHVIEVVGLHGAASSDVDALQDVTPGHLRVDGTLDPADESLINADPLCDPRLRPAILLTPQCELHDSGYDASSYFVNGHGNADGAEYAEVAYVLVMHPGNRLRQLRKAADLTQEQLAERTGYNQDRISNYENGRRPMRLAEMRVLARELNCSVADILEDVDNPDRLSESERALLEAFRNMDATGQQFLMTSAEAVAERWSSTKAA